MLKLCNSRRANYLLNVAPDTSGLIPAPSVNRLQEVGALLDADHTAGDRNAELP
jgi:alpha-L-fucosidase